jgi:hypothetical protein
MELYDMTIVIDVNPEVQAELVRQAAANGIEFSRYVANLLEEAAHPPTSRRSLGANQLDGMLQELAQFSNKIPSLPDQALSRAAFYQDRD